MDEEYLIGAAIQILHGIEIIKIISTPDIKVHYQGRFQSHWNHHNDGFNRGGRGSNRHRQFFSANIEQVQPTVQYVPYAPVQNVQQNMVPITTPQPGMNFLCRANQGTPQQQFTR